MQKSDQICCTKSPEKTDKNQKKKIRKINKNRENDSEIIVFTFWFSLFFREILLQFKLAVCTTTHIQKLESHIANLHAKNIKNCFFGGGTNLMHMYSFFFSSFTKKCPIEPHSSWFLHQNENVTEKRDDHVFICRLKHLPIDVRLIPLSLVLFI